MLLFFFSALLATLITPAIIFLYKKRKWLDDPTVSTHKKVTHEIAVPRGGGVVIFLSIILPIALFLKIDSYLLAILFGALLLTIVGFIDDLYDIHPIIRLSTGIIAALVVVGSGIGIAYVSNPFGPGVIHLDLPQLTFMFAGEVRHIWILADLFALVFILWNMNIVNWSKGVDGQMPGFVSLALLFVGLLSTQFAGDPTQFNTANLSFIVAGAFAGFLVWNWYPQKIMPGYGAGSLAGYFLSIVAILSGAKVATLLMVLSIPTADALFTIARRIIAGKSPLWGDRGHLHHKLLDEFSWSKRKIALFYWITTIIMGVLSLYLDTVGKILAICAVFSIVFGVLFYAKIKSLQRKNTVQ
jgi:UDP-GlcNAc:undecaprenyl-phosphate/decaprenyl-phosphate GlcNAc-1-phosphate transferase